MAKRTDAGDRRYSPVRSSLVQQATSLKQIATAEPAGAPAPEPERATGRRRPDREKRVRVTRSEEADAHRFVVRLSEATGTSVQLSHVLRACLRRVIREQDRVLERARDAPPLCRPPNDDAAGRARFEDRLADLLAAAFTAR